MVFKDVAINWVRNENNLFTTDELKNCVAYIHLTNHQWHVNVRLLTDDDDGPKRVYTGMMNTQAGAMELAMFFAEWLNFEG